MILEEKELEQIVGGGYKLLAALTAVGGFLAGGLDGFLRPLKCHS